VFGNVFTALIAAGEATGNLADSFRYLVRHLKWTDVMTAKVRKATRYPAVVAVVVLGVTIFLMAGVVPHVVDFLTASNQVLPIWTTALIGTSAVVQDYWPIIVGLPIVVTVSIRVMKRRSEDVAYRVDSTILQLPGIGSVVRRIALARFAQMFAVMFQSGIDILTCLDSSCRVLGNRALAEALALVRQQVQAGSTLSAALAASGEFPSQVTRMVKIGEDTGNLGQTLQEVAALYDQDVDRAIDALISMVEPMLTAVLGLIMAWIALAVFGPIYDSLGQIGI
jgi:type IV pilus assembly protein PilC